MARLPIYRRIAQELRQTIQTGYLPTGYRLPSSRALARQLGVSRNTIVGAYELLIGDGLLATHRGSGTRVLAIRQPALDPVQLLRDAHYPSTAVRFRDPDGHLIRLQR